MIEVIKKTYQTDNIDSMYRHILDTDYLEFETLDEVHAYIQKEHNTDIAKQLLENNMEPGVYEAQYDQSLYDYCEGVTSANMIIELHISELGAPLNL